MRTESPRSLPSPETRQTAPFVVLVLVSAWPLVNFANVNRDKAFSAPILLGLFAMSCLASAILYLACRRLFPRVPGGAWAFVLAAGHALFFAHAVVLPPIGRALAAGGVRVGPVAWTAAIAIILLAMGWVGTHRLAVTALAAGLAVAVAMPAGSLVAFGVRHWRGGNTPVTASGQAHGPLLSRPNVYFVIADGYGRTDTLRKFLGFDNGGLIHALEDLGFFVAGKANANYPMTFLALGSALSMDYVATPATPRYEDRTRFNPVLGGDNAVVALFKGFGYSFVQAGSGLWQETNCRGHEDLCLENDTFGAGEVFRVGFGETEMALMEMTPLFKQYLAAARARGVFAGAITNFAGLTKALRTVDTGKPLFVVAHSYPPHPPFIYSPDCSIRDEIVSDYGPLRDRTDDAAGRERYRRLYAESVECVSRQMHFFAREIVRRDPGAIVVIQSDHGSDTRVDWSPATPLHAWTREAIEERFGVINVVRVPERCRQWLYDSISPVNTFRLIVGCLQDRQPDLLPDRSFVAAYENHPEFGLVHEYSAR